MKKYKVYFSVFNLFAETQKEVVRLQQIFKGLMAIITGATWFASDSTHALIIALFAGLFDVFLSCFWFVEEPLENGNKTKKQ